MFNFKSGCPDLPTITHINDVMLGEGESLSLECLADGHPDPRVWWTKDEGDRSIQPSAFLRIDKVTSKDSGTYQCHAENSVNSYGPSVTMTVRINVTRK